MTLSHALRICLRATGFALAITGVSALALPEDADQPIEIKADRAEVDDELGMAVYSGSVRLDQGTMSVTADTLTIRTADGDVTRITAEGEQARYEQLPEAGQALVVAQAGVITFLPGEDRIELEGKARLQQAEDSFEGERIVYDIGARRVAASAGADGEPITMRIQPSRLRSATPPDTPERSD